ncbi:MAG: hypothetical protein NT126_03650 [Bacteroidetes bacterium]|nr:hypothetical protein [Bacteroidota bacterium]
MKRYSLTVKKNKSGLFLLLALSSFTGAFSFPSIGFTQKKMAIKIQLTDSIHHSGFMDIQKQIESNKTFSDSNACNAELQSILLKLHNNGFLAAGFDDVKYDSVSCHARLFLGNRYEWMVLTKGNVDESLLTGSGFRQKLYEGKTFSDVQVRKLEEKILVNCQNAGYPFASVKLDSITFSGSAISAKLNLVKNKFIRFDSVVVKGSATIAPVYMYHYIGIKPGSVYNEAMITKIPSRIRELPFVKQSSPERVLFTEKETKLEIYLENKKASQFDGVIGLMPDIQNPGKYSLTGEAHLKLQNALARGEVMELNWKQLPVQTQDLKLHFLYPFLMNTPFGLDAGLALFKKDTTYVDVAKDIGIQFQFTGNNYIKGFIHVKQSTLESTFGLQYATVLPDYADVSSTSYGLSFHYEKLDYRLNPRTGFSLETTGSTGTRTISKNRHINPDLYSSIRLTTTEYHAQLKFDYFIPVQNRHVIDFGISGALLNSPDIFVNELYRFGGLKTLRGFDEESLLASLFTVGKIEYRYLLEQNSYLFAFFNESYYENKSRNRNIHDTPYGFGSGITFETKLGIMSVSYALGKEFDNPVYFRNGKIHFGILNYF